jgi:hypothetical protein
MNSYHQLYAQSEQRRVELMREAEIDRLLQAPETQGLSDRLLSGLGEWMVNEGTRLKQRRAATETQPAAYSWQTANR